MNERSRELEKSCICPDIDYAQWEDRHLQLNDEPFLSHKISLAFRVPVGLHEEIARLVEKAKKLSLEFSTPHRLFQRELGLFKGELLLGLAHDPGPEVGTTINGKFLSTVFRGPYEELGKARKRFVSKIEEDLGIKPKTVFYWYVNCPKCWSKDGGPVTIILSQIGKAR